MDLIENTNEKIERLRENYQQLIKIVSEFEKDFPGRNFTIEGHLIGSIGQIMSTYFYGVELYDVTKGVHTGEVNGKKVQIKIMQKNDMSMTRDPDNLIVLYLNKSGQIYEVYNGLGKRIWDLAKPEGYNKRKRHIALNKLMKIDEEVCPDERIPTINPIEKMRPEYKSTTNRINDN